MSKRTNAPWVFVPVFVRPHHHDMGAWGRRLPVPSPPSPLWSSREHHQLRADQGKRTRDGSAHQNYRQALCNVAVKA